MTNVRQWYSEGVRFKRRQRVTDTHQDRIQPALGGLGTWRKGRRFAPEFGTLNSLRSQVISVSQPEPSLRFCEGSLVASSLVESP